MENASNEMIIDALIHGTNSIGLSSKQLEDDNLMKDVMLDMIQLYVEGNIPSQNGPQIHWKNKLYQSDSFSYNDDLFSAIIKHQNKFGRVFHLDMAGFQESGLNPVDTLVMMLLQVKDVLDKGSHKGLTIDELSSKVELHLASGYQYLVDIAMVRSCRFLYAKLLDAKGVEHNCSKLVHVSCHTSKGLQSPKDKYNNLLRGTTGSMSAVLGSCDSLCVTPFDFWWDQSKSGLRWARNTHHLLAEESLLNMVQDPMAGSYSIEQITNTIVKAAWEQFIQVQDGTDYWSYRDSKGFIDTLEKDKKS
ncbi:MAG: methylmalonyl-CoA mutase family protein, partial [Bacteroidota bacterium]